MADLLRSLTTGDLDAFQSAELRRAELARDLVASSYIRGDYVMSSGSASDYYIDPKLFMTKPTVLRRLAGLLAASIPFDVDRLAGSEPGSLAIAVAVSIETGLPYVGLHIEAHNRQVGSTIAGEVHAGERVLLIEDVIKSGSHSINGARALTQRGVEVAGVLAVIDREEGGAQAIADAGFAVEPLYRISDLVQIAVGQIQPTGEKK